jgi:hypothetical protein
MRVLGRLCQTNEDQVRGPRCCSNALRPFRRDPEIPPQCRDPIRIASISPSSQPCCGDAPRLSESGERAAIHRAAKKTGRLEFTNVFQI